MKPTLSFLRKLFYFLSAIILFGVGVFLFYYLPSTTKAYLVGTEIKRELIQGPKGDSFKDVRYIVARDFKTGKTLMFRNEDVPWPPYFKFNSGDLSGDVMNIQQHSPDKVVNITYYGFRVPLLSLYPNATKFKIVPKDYKHVPWFNIIFLSSLFLIFFFSFFKVRRRGKRKKEKALEEEKIMAEPAPQE